MRAKIRIRVVFFCLLIIIACPNFVFAGTPEVSNLYITDVTPKSFSVIWAASEASTANLEVYKQPEGTAIPSESIISHPVGIGNEDIKTAAENNGVMKVQVINLEPDTAYAFKTSTTSITDGTITYYPENEFMSVTTEVMVVRTYEDGDDTLPCGNDIIIEECYFEDESPAEGTLLVATIAGVNHPLTAFVGDGVDSPNALIDLNNAFSRDNNSNLDLKSGENLTLLNFRGMQGYSIVTHKIPEDLDLCEIKPADFALQSGRNMVSFQIGPNDTDVLSVLDPIIDDVVSIWAFDNIESKWKFYVKDGLPFLNELTDLHSYIGFFLFLDNAASWLVDGTLNNDPIQLKAGINFVGYSSIEYLKISDAMESIWEDFISIWTFDSEQNKWIFFVKNGLPFLNELEYVEPGKAYYVYVEKDCEWTNMQ